MSGHSAGARARLAASLAANLGIIAMEVVGVRSSFLYHWLGIFQYYTDDSNILALAACLVYSAAAAACLAKGLDLPAWAKQLELTAASCLAVTFTVVMAILAPLLGGFRGYAAMLSGSMLYHHLLCPLALAACFIWLEPEPALAPRSVRQALIPTVIYAIAAVTLNLLGVMRGPYPFLLLYQQPPYMTVFWCVVIMGIAYLAALAIYRANRYFSRRPDR